MEDSVAVKKGNSVGERRVQIEKVLQQIAATALKHSAQKVEIILDRSPVIAKFYLASQSAPSTKLSLDPLVFSSVLIEMVTWRMSSASRLLGTFAVDCRGVNVSFQLSFSGAEVKENPPSGNGQNKLVWHTLILSRFQVDKRPQGAEGVRTEKSGQPADGEASAKAAPSIPRPLTGQDVFVIVDSNGKSGSRSINGAESVGDITPTERPHKLVLVAERLEQQVENLCREFQKSGYVLRVISSDVSSVAKATNYPPSVIILDYELASVDVPSAIRDLRQKPLTAAVPIVVLTHVHDEDTEHELLEAGADTCCLKTSTDKVILKRVERLLEAQAA